MDVIDKLKPVTKFSVYLHNESYFFFRYRPVAVFIDLGENFQIKKKNRFSSLYSRADEFYRHQC